MSGRCGAYFKPAFDETSALLDYVLWLQPGLSGEEAMDVAEATGSHGLMRRGRLLMRYGLRWKTQKEYDAAVTLVLGVSHLAGTTR